MYLSKPEYERSTAASRDARMSWWRNARFGMFVHYGLYSQLGANEWAMAIENRDVAEYEKLAGSFQIKEGAPREWARLAKAAGMKYMVFTTRHHEGFSFWDSKVNPYNSVNYGSKRDIVREFVDACREFGLRVGFYSSLMDWHHPDAFNAGRDLQARLRFTDYIKELNRELMTQYGKIDILWYDVPRPMESWEGWNSLEMNQMVRGLQPDIIINNRSQLEEDFGTPEGHLTAVDRDWEACMTFNDISWGYVDSEQAAPYSYNAQRIIRMLNTVTRGKGNLLLNIGPMPDGSVPAEAVKPLEQVGAWLAENGEAVYGAQTGVGLREMILNGVSPASLKGKTVYLWNLIWPSGGELRIGGIFTKLKAARLVKDNAPIAFEQEGHRLILKGLPPKSPDSVAGIAVIALEFDEVPRCVRASYFPQLQKGEVFGMAGAVLTES